MKSSSITFCSLLIAITYQEAKSVISRLERLIKVDNQSSMVVNTTHGLIEGIEKIVYNKTVDAYFGVLLA